MALQVYIRLTAAGLGTGPFDIYENLDLVNPIANNVDKNDLILGYTVTTSTYATFVRIQSDSFGCTNYIDVDIANASCPIFETGSYTGNSYYAYPNYIIPNTKPKNMVFSWESYNRPNRFNVYDSTGLLYTSGWKGIADYPGPWGSSLNTTTRGTESICFNSLTGRYVLVEAGPASPSTPESDTFDWVLDCSGICPSPTPTSTATPSVTPTETLTPTITPTQTLTPTITPTQTLTPTITPTQTLTPTVTQTNEPTPTITPTETLTPTVTRTVTPTITQTPTNTVTPTSPGVQYNLDPTNFTTAENACRNGVLGGTVKYLPPTYTTPQNGIYVYNESSLTTFYDGGDQYHKMFRGASSWAVRIGTGGLISDVVDCSTIPSVTPTPTTTLTPTVTRTATPTVTPTSSLTPTISLTPSISLTPTTTTTVTPTITKTPTTTPTPTSPAIQYNLDPTNYSTAENACRNGVLGGTVKYLPPTYTTPQNGIYVYDDSNLTSFYDGGDQYHKMFRGGSSWAVRIGTGGLISDVVDCSTIPSLTSTPTVTSTPTITPTNTITPTVTPSTTPLGSAIQLSTPQNDECVACRLTSYSQTRYVSPSDSTPTIGDIVYQNVELTTVFNGNSQWFKTTWGSPTEYSIQIATNGQVLDVTNCSTCPSQTPTPTPTTSETPTPTITPTNTLTPSITETPTETPTPTPTPIPCYEYTATAGQTDLDNSDDQTVYFQYTDCNGNPQTLQRGTTSPATQCATSVGSVYILISGGQSPATSSSWSVAGSPC